MKKILYIFFFEPLKEHKEIITKIDKELTSYSFQYFL